MIRAWLLAFCFTQAVEVPIYSIGLRCSPLAAFGASAITHPIIWFVLFPLMPGSYWVKGVAAELFAWGVEAAYFAYLIKKPRAWLWSLIANASSLGAGLLCRELFGFP